ncbi:hypothetical protein [Piscinibacter sp.]|jgi:hypothetical protein|uniref:hypothetical protein n=1 Tax=Piscinibacter sp. TaxID=1903157 RepID=UPI00355A8172
MSTQTLSSVATHVVGQYSQVGKLIVGAYRAGAQRIVSGANTRYAAFLNSRSLPLVNEAVKASLIDVQQQFAGLVEGGIASGSNRAEQAIEFLAGGINGGIQRIAATSERVETAFGSTAITTVGSLTMPAAQVSLEIANRAVEGTKRLSARVIGAEAEVVEVAATAKRTVKKAVRRVKARS